MENQDLTIPCLAWWEYEQIYKDRFLSEFSRQIAKQVGFFFAFLIRLADCYFKCFITHFLQQFEGIRSGKKSQIIKK